MKYFEALLTVKEDLKGIDGAEGVIAYIEEITNLYELGPLQQKHYDKLSKSAREIADALRAGITVTEVDVPSKVYMELEESPLFSLCPEDHVYWLREDCDLEG